MKSIDFDKGEFGQTKITMASSGRDIDPRYYENYPLTWELDEPRDRMTLKLRSIHSSTARAIEKALENEEEYEMSRQPMGRLSPLTWKNNVAEKIKKD